MKILKFYQTNRCSFKKKNNRQVIFSEFYKVLHCC